MPISSLWQRTRVLIGFDLAEDVLEIVEENRELNNLTFEQAAIGVKNLNDDLIKKYSSGGLSKKRGS